MRSFDPLQDVRANNFIGTKSLTQNLRFVPADLEVRGLTQGDREVLLAGLDDAVPAAHLEAMWDIVWQRWQYWRGLGGAGHEDV